MASTSLSTPITSSDPHETSTLRRRAIRGGAVLMGTRLLIQVFSSAVTILVARYLLPFDYGVMTNGSLFLGLADLLAEAGVGKALVQRREVNPDDLAEGFTLSLLLSAALYTAFWICAGPVAIFLRCPELVLYLRVAALALFLIPFRTVPMAVLEHRLAMGRQSAIFLGSAVIQTTIVLTLAMRGWGYWSMIGGVFAARLVEIAALTWQTRWVPRLRRPGTSSGNLISFSLTWMGTGLLWYVYSNSDFAVVGRLVGPVELGYYSFAFILVSMPVQKITANCNQIAYPIFCRLQHDPERLRGWFLRLTVLLGFVGFPIMVGMALVANDGIATLLGPRWKPAVLPFQILCGAGVVMVLSNSLPSLLNALGRPDINFRYALACTILFPVGFYLMGSRYGLNGVALTWSLLYPVIFVFLVHLTRPITGLGLLDLLSAQKSNLIALAIMTVSVLAAQRLLGPTNHTALRLAVSILVGVMSYAGAIWVFGRRTVIVDLGSLWRELRGTKRPA